MAEQTTILESMQDVAYVKSNRRFLQQEQSTTDALFDKVEVEMDAEVDAEKPEESELWLPPMYTEVGTKIVDISDED